MIDASVKGQHRSLHVTYQKQLANNPVLTSVVNVSLYSKFTFVLSVHMYDLSLSCCTCKQDVRERIGFCEIDMCDFTCVCCSRTLLSHTSYSVIISVDVVLSYLY